ncbi:MAG: hypothetical protein KME23_14160 [Goleter apudmare HA4340-LM2]|nr:hypothetical protein [Goleter apudmare HA4340-LM2]
MKSVPLQVVYRVHTNLANGCKPPQSLQRGGTPTDNLTVVATTGRQPCGQVSRLVAALRAATLRERFQRTRRVRTAVGTPRSLPERTSPR